MITHLKIQMALGLGLLIIVLGYHASVRVVPGLSSSWSHLQLSRAIPYLITVVSVIYVKRLAKQRSASYSEFIQNSPGGTVDSSAMTYGPGHGHD